MFTFASDIVKKYQTDLVNSGTSMTQPLSDFVESVRTAATIEDEKFFIATELAQIRALTKKMDPELRPRVASKLLFLDMLGQNIAWGQMEAIALMTHERFSFKRIGYICTAAILDQTTELTVLVTQTLLSDLNNPDPNIQNLALGFIANLGTQEVCRSVAVTVQKLMESRHAFVMKAAGMATVRIIRTNPDLSDSYKNSVQTLLNNPTHGVVIAGINLVMAMIRAEPKLARSWSQFAIPFTKILKTLTTSRPTREFCYGVFNDPYLQIKTLQALAMLRKKSEELDVLLQSIVSGTDTKRNTGRALLYQAVETIVAVSKKASLRGLAFNQVGRLLSMRDPNVLYSALSSFARVLYASRSVINRGSVDAMALQRYKSQIVKCLDHQDPSIRRRALDVISALIDEKNVETLVPEILSYVKLADAEFRTDLVSKIYAASQRFAPNCVWNFDTVHRILIDSGDYVPADILAAFCDLVTKTVSLHDYAVEKLRESLISNANNQNLIQVAAYIIGELSQEDKGELNSLKQLAVLPQTKPETLLYILTAVAKLSVRIGTIPEAIELCRLLVENNNLEVQQRSGELMNLLAHPEACVQILEPVSRATETDDKSSIMIQQGSATDRSGEHGAGDDVLLMMLDTKKKDDKKAEPVDDLLNLDMATSVAPANKTNNSDLLSVLGQSGQQQPQVQMQMTELLVKPDFAIYGQVKANAADPRQVALRLLIFGTGSTNLNDFKLAFNASPGWQLNAQPPDGSVLLPNREKPISQILYLMNSTNAPFQLQVKATYRFGSQPLSEIGVITTLPPPQ